MDFKQQFGPWALVTGASSGLGEEFAHQLAKRGLNIVLTARNDAKLQRLSELLISDYGVETRVVPTDLSEVDSVDVLYVRCADLDIGLVISNAGATTMRNYMRTGLDEVRNSIQLNVSSHSDIARYFGEKIISQRQGRGGILFMSSIIALQGTPYLAIYSAAKAYILSLAEALHYENIKTGLHVTAVTPGPIATPMLQMRPESKHLTRQGHLALLPVGKVVYGSLDALQKNKVTYTPGIFVRFYFGVLRRYFFTRPANVKYWGRIVKRYMKTLVNGQFFHQHIHK